jgi:hypothetical protein
MSESAPQPAPSSPTSEERTAPEQSNLPSVSQARSAGSSGASPPRTPTTRDGLQGGSPERRKWLRRLLGGGGLIGVGIAAALTWCRQHPSNSSTQRVDSLAVAERLAVLGILDSLRVPRQYRTKYVRHHPGYAVTVAIPDTLVTYNDDVDDSLACKTRKAGLIRGIVQGRTNTATAQDIPRALPDAVVMLIVVSQDGRKSILYSSWQLTGQYGEYFFPDVPVGDYKILVAHPDVWPWLAPFRSGHTDNAIQGCVFADGYLRLVRIPDSSRQ